MKTEEIQGITLQSPNKPFNLHLADGRTIRVETRDHVAFPPVGKRMLYLWDSERKAQWVDVALITGIDAAPPSQP